MNDDNLNIRLDEDLTSQMTINKNLTQDIIVTNTDKVTIILNDHHRVIKKKMEWLTPLGIFLTTLATLLTAKFDKTVFGINPVLWEAIFAVTCIVTFIYCIYLIINAIKYFNKGTTEEFIIKLKNQSQVVKNVVLPQIDASKIIIHSAKYTSEGRVIDLTEKISSLVSNNVLDFLANNDLGGDPYPGKIKTLEINCSINGKKKAINAVEGALIKLQ